MKKKLQISYKNAHCRLLSVQTKAKCDEPITLEECTLIVEKGMKLNKSPGLDGLPVEISYGQQ